MTEQANHLERAVNIGPKERRTRVLMGIAMLAVGVGLTAALILGHVGPWWFTSLFLPFWLGALGFFQAQEKT